MSRNPERKLAPHVQAAIAAGQGKIGGQAKTAGAVGGWRPAAAHVQAALRTVQPRLQTELPDGRKSPYVEAGTGAMQPGVASSLPAERPRAPHVQMGIERGLQPKLHTGYDAIRFPPALHHQLAARRNKMVPPPGSAAVGSRMVALRAAQTPAASSPAPHVLAAVARLLHSCAQFSPSPESFSPPLKRGPNAVDISSSSRPGIIQTMKEQPDEKLSRRMKVGKQTAIDVRNKLPLGPGNIWKNYSKKPSAKLRSEGALTLDRSAYEKWKESNFSTKVGTKNDRKFWLFRAYFAQLAKAGYCHQYASLAYFDLLKNNTKDTISIVSFVLFFNKSK